MYDDRDGAVTSSPPTVPSPPPARAEHVPWTVADVVVVAALVLFVASPLTSALVRALAPPRLVQAVGFPAVMFAAGLATVLWVGARYRGRLVQLFGSAMPRLRDVGAGLWHGLVAFFGLNLVIGLLFTWLIEVFQIDVDPVQQRIRELAADPALVPFVLVSVVVAAPIAEELFFRGLLYQWLRDRAGPWLGILGSGVVFGFVHWEADNLVGAAYMVASLSLVGMYLAWVLHRRRTLVTPIVMHATFNLLAAVWILQGLG